MPGVSAIPSLIPNSVARSESVTSAKSWVIWNRM